MRTGRPNPAILGGEPAFPDGLSLARPSLSDPAAVARLIEGVIESGVLTNGPLVRELEVRAEEYLGVRECIAVSSCTAGLMILLRAADISGNVVLPSFTFSATAHAVIWNGLRTKFADVDPESCTLSEEAARDAIGMRTSAILATHTYGTPCDTEGLAAIARRHGLRLFFDAAHAFGSLRNGKHVGGFGDGEVFSFSPTKVLIAGEGGLIATNDEVLAHKCRIGRDYGNPGDYDCRFVGLNARMSELHAAVALASFDELEEAIAERNVLAAAYRSALEGIPGISFPVIAPGDRSTYKDFTIIVDREAFGLAAEELGGALRHEGIDTRRYYVPPVHAQTAYQYVGGPTAYLPYTEHLVGRVLTLPLWRGMGVETIRDVAAAIDKIRAGLTQETSRGNGRVSRERSKSS